MHGEALSLGLIAAVHVIALGVLVWALLDGERVDLRGWWPGDDDGGGSTPPEPAGAPSGRGALPLPDAVPARVRFREGGTLAGTRMRPARRPGHEPRPREPAPS